MRPGDGAGAPAGPDGNGLRLERLTKCFGGLVAVHELTVAVRPGEIYGLIGPNGSGKTTTVKMLSGLYRPTAGRIVIDGVDLLAEPERAKRVLGYLPDEPFVGACGPDFRGRSADALATSAGGLLTRRCAWATWRGRGGWPTGSCWPCSPGPRPGASRLRHWERWGCRSSRSPGRSGPAWRRRRTLEAR